MIPYHDDKKTLRTPVVTWTLIGLNLLAWVGLQGAGTMPALPASVCTFGLIPGELTGAVPPGTPVPLGEGLACVTEGGRHLAHVLTSMFMHGSWMHVLGNMWFLHVFGNNVEDAMGRLRFLAFYLLSGVLAAGLQVALSPASAMPMVGASGAISGVMGGYLVLYPRVRVFTLVPIGFFLTSIALPAWTMLLYWFGLQLLGGATAIAGAMEGGVAFWAHVGGFIGGALMVKPFAHRPYVVAHRASAWRPAGRFDRAA